MLLLSILKRFELRLDLDLLAITAYYYSNSIAYFVLSDK